MYFKYIPCGLFMNSFISPFVSTAVNLGQQYNIPFSRSPLLTPMLPKVSSNLLPRMQNTSSQVQQAQFLRNARLLSTWSWRLDGQADFLANTQSRLEFGWTALEESEQALAKRETVLKVQRAGLIELGRTQLRQ